MKMFKFVFPLLLSLFMLSSNQSNAQEVNDFLSPYFNLDNKTIDRLFDFEDMNPNASYGVTRVSQKKIVELPKILLDKLGVAKAPKNVKKINGSLIVKKDGNCYEIACKKNNCDCTLLWRDANNDKKIQPRKELRCVCTQTKEPCEIGGKKVSCTRN